jgi:hypothetical protein
MCAVDSRSPYNRVDLQILSFNKVIFFVIGACTEQGEAEGCKQITWFFVVLLKLLLFPNCNYFILGSCYADASSICQLVSTLAVA